MENLRHGSLNLRLLRVAGDSHSDCDPTGQRVSMPLPLLSSSSPPFPLSSPLLSSLHGTHQLCWWQVSSPTYFRSCSGADLSWEIRVFLNQQLRKTPSLVGAEKKGCKARPACSSGSAAIAFFGSYTSHCSGLFFKLFYFLYYA